MNLLNFNWIYWKLIQNLNRSWRYCHIPVCSMRRKWLCGRQEKKKETHSVLIAASFELIFISLPLSDYFRIQWGKNLSDISLCFMEGCALFFLRCGVVINFMECKISVCLGVLWISVDVYWEFLLILMTVAWYKSEISGGIFHSLSWRFLHKATGDRAVCGGTNLLSCVTAVIVSLKHTVCPMVFLRIHDLPSFTCHYLSVTSSSQNHHSPSLPTGTPATVYLPRTTTTAHPRLLAWILETADLQMFFWGSFRKC